MTNTLAYNTMVILTVLRTFRQYQELHSDQLLALLSILDGGSDKHSSLLQYGINYLRKWLLVTNTLANYNTAYIT